MFNKNEQSQVPLPNRSAPFMNDIVDSAVGVTKLLKGLNPSKALCFLWLSLLDDCRVTDEALLAETT